jgi:hypothetical protein
VKSVHGAEEDEVEFPNEATKVLWWSSINGDVEVNPKPETRNPKPQPQFPTPYPSPLTPHPLPLTPCPASLTPGNAHGTEARG